MEAEQFGWGFCKCFWKWKTSLTDLCLLPFTLTFLYVWMQYWSLGSRLCSNYKGTSAILEFGQSSLFRLQRNKCGLRITRWRESGGPWLPEDVVDVPNQSWTEKDINLVICLSHCFFQFYYSQTKFLNTSVWPHAHPTSMMDIIN